MNTKTWLATLFEEESRKCFLVVDEIAHYTYQHLFSDESRPANKANQYQDTNSFYALATNYMLSGGSFSEIHEHNAAISDDDRMSLTTAVSDEDDGESVMNSPYKAKQTGTAAASFNCTGAVRKAG
ncbi:hypothetical protein QE152_g23032 [Popillia japonica]|uniref:Uncharacterized protein n=1 Tax=Popillia japonica TaxID=7064 RepID=A0AAW1KGR0_POPJA